MNDLFRLLPAFRRHARGLVLALLLSMLTLAAGIGLLGVSGWFITAAALAGASLTFDLFAPSALVRGLSFLRIVSRYAERVTGHDATLKLLADLRTLVFRRLIPLAPGRLGRLGGGDLVSRLTGDVDALDTVFLLAIAPIATGLVLTALLALVLWTILPAAALALLAAAALAFVVAPVLLIRAGRSAGSRLQGANARLRGAVVDAVEGHADIVAFAAEGAIEARFSAAADDAARARRGQATVAATGQAIVQAAAGLAMVAALAGGLGPLAAGTIAPATLVGVLLAIVALFEIAGPVMRGAARFGAAAAAARRIAALADLEPLVVDSPEPLGLPEGADLRFEAVRFGYDPARPVLDDLSLAVAPGERVAIVGPSGAGKSTILHLLLRIMDVDAGRVTVAGADVRSVTQADLHRRVALLDQRAPVFIGTLGDNLRIGDPAADDARLYDALDKARLGDFVRGLPGGLESWVGEAGQTLSAGQARRLCLARALLSPAAIIALDEPTAGLDPETEEAFFRDLAGATAGRTVVLVTHAALPEGTVDRVLTLADRRLVGA